MLRLRKILLYDLGYYLIALFSIVYYLVILNYLPGNSVYKGDEKEFIGIITSYHIDGNSLFLEVKSQEKIIGTYYFKSEDEKNNYLAILKLGVKIFIKGSIEKPLNNTIPNTFNYNKYLKNKKIYWIIKVEETSVIDSKCNLFYAFKNYIVKRIDNLPYSSAYLKTFILGNKNEIDNNIMNEYQKNGITHLFAISGMHVNLFASFIIGGLKKLKISENKRYLVTIGFILFYATLTNYTASILRAGLFFSLLLVNKIFYFFVKPVNILIFAGSILVFLNPYIINDIGFQYSFVVSFGLVISVSRLKNNNYFLNLLYVSVTAFLFSIPISLNNFYELNLLSIVNNLIFVPLVTIIVYPLSLLVFMFPFLDDILSIIITLMENINKVMASVNHLNVIIPKLSLFLCFWYYLLLILCILKNNLVYKILLVMILIFNKYECKFDSAAYVYFLDVWQGDSAVIRAPYDDEVIMIDTGGRLEFEKEEWAIKNKKYNISNNIIVFLKSVGITKINYLFISHGDDDHMGEAINITNNFKVENIVLNIGEYNENEIKLINNVKNIPIHQNVFNTKTKIKSLNSRDYNNENDNSLVLLIEFYNYTILMMGDASKKTEAGLSNVEGVNILKLGHHGSKTSSSKEFLEKVKPDLAIISSGRNNHYNHPSLDTMSTLSELNISSFNTANDGTIWFKINKNTKEIFTTIP